MGAVFVCAACGKKKETSWPDPQYAVELAAWALDAGWRPLWGQDRLGSRYVQLHCSDRCADAQITKKGSLRKRVAKLEEE